MSDIAMLVAEEYERRVRNLRKADVGADGKRQIDMASCASFLVPGLKNKIREENINRELVKWVWEPKSQIGVAASTSFFSA